jgi:hypothetical protein
VSRADVGSWNGVWKRGVGVGEGGKMSDRDEKPCGPPREVLIPVRFRDVEIGRFQSENGMLQRQLIEEVERDGAETGPAVNCHQFVEI